MDNGTKPAVSKNTMAKQRPKHFVPAVYDSFADAIGNTPVIMLEGASERTGCKCVYLPSGLAEADCVVNQRRVW
jgi:hypothetical protein